MATKKTAGKAIAKKATPKRKAKAPSLSVEEIMFGKPQPRPSRTQMKVVVYCYVEGVALEEAERKLDLYLDGNVAREQGLKIIRRRVTSTFHEGVK